MAALGHRPHVDTKQRWRARAKRFRDSGRGETEGVAEAVGSWLTELNPSGWVVVFDALPGEVSLQLIEDGEAFARVGLTRTPEVGRDLTVHSAEAPRESHRFGYSQPIAAAAVVPDSEISVVLVPGLVFSLSGQRLGWGAGYYDRFLGRLDSEVLRVGISDGLVVGALPSDAHDVKMTHIATAHGVFDVPVSPDDLAFSVAEPSDQTEPLRHDRQDLPPHRS